MYTQDVFMLWVVFRSLYWVVGRSTILLSKNLLQYKMHSMLTETSFVCGFTIIGQVICGSINAISLQYSLI